MTIQECFDRFGLIRTKQFQRDTGNGALYSVLFIIFTQGFDLKDLVKRVEALWQKDKGVLWRTPENTYGQQSHDDYLAIACLCLLTGNKTLARSIIWSSIKKFGFMQNDFKEENAFWKSQMYRFPHVWMVMIAAAFPNRIIKWICGISLQFILILSDVNLNDVSGTQLRLLQAKILVALFRPSSMMSLITSINSSGKSVRSMMTGYWQPDHQILDGYEACEKAYGIK